MIEISCQACGAKAGVQSLLAAAQQPCSRCGQLLMGALGSSRRTARPAGFDGCPTSPQREYGAGSSAGLWLGVFVGMLGGVALVAAVAGPGRVFPLQWQCAVLGALMGVLLAPVIAFSSFLSMIILPFSLEGILGDGVWTRLAKANNERRLGPLFVPFFVLVVLPMALCGWGGSRMRAIETPMVISAGLGAIVLGALIGGVCGAVLAGRRQIR